ncbi:la-related protein 6C-like isoform X2 [Chenopodium quinoa]|uniref:la-related protein 6C-like isoform X2 n=1 Tax=Chenopodium quinoa TaxID=63459 RepID=UPI000B770A6E|nr:la-related protein 6C-like isoform X2 [Chenopodium quinoa]
MAQEQMKRSPEKDIKSGGGSISISSDSNKDNGRGGGGGGGFKFNAQASEFVPRSYTTSSSYGNHQMLSTGYFYPCVQFLQDGDHVMGTPSTDWYYVSPSPPPSPRNNNSNTNNNNNNNNNSNNGNDLSPVHPSNFSDSPTSQSQSSLSRSNSLNDDLHQKIVKQVEYLFSDLSLMANDTMAKHVSKDPEGYVPIPVIASMKKIKALVTDHQMLVQALRSSTKLVVSKENKKVKRRSPFTESYRDELQCRTVMVENLPDDHSYQNLEKIFSVVGSVKAIRLCHPPEANPSRSKNEAIISNKLHALVEYENAEFAEKAAEKLNDERDWRKGLRVRVMQRRTPKSILKTRKSDFDLLTDDDESTHGESPKEISQPNGSELVKDNSLGEESSGVPKKLASPRGRAKTKGRAVQSLNDRGLLSSPIHSIGVSRCDTLRTKLINKGPRMPDGTRGFTMGRGKPIITSSTPSSPVG